METMLDERHIRKMYQKIPLKFNLSFSSIKAKRPIFVIDYHNKLNAKIFDFHLIGLN